MRFIFDENLGIQLSNGLKAFGEDTCHLNDWFEKGTKDEVWLQYIGENGWFLITVDKRIRRRPVEKEALKKYKVGAFFLSGKQMGRWNYIKQIVNCWEKIKAITMSESPPFAYQVNRYGTDITKLPLD
jgi:hypothetical protein